MIRHYRRGLTGCISKVDRVSALQMTCLGKSVEMSLNSPLERPGLPRIVRSSNAALVVVRPERPSYRGLLQRPDLTRIVQYSSLATSKKSRPTTSQLRSVYARTTGGARKENISRIASRDRRGTARNKTLQETQETKVISSLTSFIGITSPTRAHKDLNTQSNGCFCEDDDSTPVERADNSDGKEMGIECVCCFDMCAFENMSQCTDGHLICVDCLTRYTEEVACGTGKVALYCTKADCSALHPHSALRDHQSRVPQILSVNFNITLFFPSMAFFAGELERCVTPTLLIKLANRIQEENINRANLDNLARCPKCNFAAVVPPTMIKFQCLRETCGQVSFPPKTTCLRCGMLWSRCNHKSCLVAPTMDCELDADRVRMEYEEKMTRARVRVCSACKIAFTKTRGCNKMTCRCGMSMCYLCRTPNIDFSHFCSHPRSPGEPCSSCDKCFLWTDAEDMDNQIIENMRREAQEIIHSLEKSTGPNNANS